MTDSIESITVIRQEIREIIGNLIVDLLVIPWGGFSLFTCWSNGQQSLAAGEVVGQPDITL